MKRGKKYIKSTKGLDREVTYSVVEGVKKAKSLSYSNFTGTLELHVDVKLPKDRDAKSIKGAVSLPNSNTTKAVRIAVFATPDKDEAAKVAGADLVVWTNL
jgi:large subunit ribosomal protein L1